jgi:WD40 repeat protein
VATGQQRAALTGHTRGVSAVAVAPDGSWLATGDDDGTVEVWDVATGQQRAALTGHTRGVSAVAVAPDGSWLATGSHDKTVRVWDVATRQARALMRLDNSVAASTWLSASALAVGGPAGLYLFDFLTDANPGTAQALTRMT